MDVKELNNLITSNSQELFYELSDEIKDESITDIEWDGYNLWITRLGSGSFISDKELSEKYVENLSIRLSNIMGVSFNRIHPILEANTESLRISIWHESRCGRKSIAIRKIPQNLRFNHLSLLKSDYASKEIITLLENCVMAHLSTVIGGQPHAGKTELLKFLSTFIPADEKAGVFEDNQEIHYRTINPMKKCVEFFVDDKVGYQDIIKAGLRHNIDWILLSESRGPEVVELLNSLSTGAFCMTTMHLDDVRDMPDRMYNMLGTGNAPERFINSIYKYIDMAVLVECDKYERRRISQVGFFSRENGKNKCSVIYEDGKRTNEELPEFIKDRFRRYGLGGK
ncbi:MAG: ATPase, T2SS/T4P/T4SS family [Lachnospira sp.]